MSKSFGVDGLTFNADLIILKYIFSISLGYLFPNVSQLCSKLLMEQASNTFNLTTEGAN